MSKLPGQHMAAECADAMNVFWTAAGQTVSAPSFENVNAIYTIARGSSEAAATVLRFEFMQALGIPVTSLPLSVFSVGEGATMNGCGAVVVSQSGASEDLVASAKGAATAGASVVAITNSEQSPVEQAAQVTVPIDAGPELAIPATKTLLGSIGAGVALLASLKPDYARKIKALSDGYEATELPKDLKMAIKTSLMRDNSVYVVGRGAGVGVAQEIALKLKECCAIHAEAFSSSEVLHGPLQLAVKPLTVLIVDTGEQRMQSSLDQAEAKFLSIGCDVYRIKAPQNTQAKGATAVAAAFLIYAFYPVVLDLALDLGFDPDEASLLSKVTMTR